MWGGILFSVLIGIILMAGFIIAAEGSFQISSNESSKFPLNPKEDEKEDRKCVSSWQCNEWTNCKNFVQTRFCEDNNYCSEPNLKYERRACVPLPGNIDDILNEEIPIISISYGMLLLILFLLIIILLEILLINKLLNDLKSKKIKYEKQFEKRNTKKKLKNLKNKS